MKNHTIVVLPDGETWTTIDGCSILVIDDSQFRDLADGRIDANDLKALSEVSLGTPKPTVDAEWLALYGSAVDSDHSLECSCCGRVLVGDGPAVPIVCHDCFVKGKVMSDCDPVTGEEYGTGA